MTTCRRSITPGRAPGPVAACVLLLALAAPSATAQPAADAALVARVDAIFERWARPDSPGCAVGASRAGTPVLSRAYGLANLEYDVPLTPASVFESGSVAKQFTAAAIGLLALDGKLAVTDPARKYVPELPAFAAGITIDHLLTHTSGLRSQWPLLSIAGRPPGEAVHTVPEILDLVSRQQRLNFAPGEHYLYNNTAFTLLGVIVARVSGQSLQDFSAARLFGPLGMTSTAWRVDHRQVVKGRATAYRRDRDHGFRTFMSFTDVVGNGGLLTTVGDLLRWNANLDDPAVGGRALTEWLETRGRLDDGTENEYARGLVVTTYQGLREVSHGGSTAGYQTFLARYPGPRVSVAVLCNTTGTNPAALAHQVADLLLGTEARTPATPAFVSLDDAVLRQRAGLYVHPASGAVLEVVAGEGGLIAGGADGARLRPLDPWRFVAGDRTTLMFVPDPAGGPAPVAVVEAPGNTRPTRWQRAARAAPTAAALADYAGSYRSPELDVAYRVVVDEGRLRLRFRGEPPQDLRPADRDAFLAGGQVIRFTRAADGTVDGFSAYAGRVWHLRFDREAR